MSYALSFVQLNGYVHAVHFKQDWVNSQIFGTANNRMAPHPVGSLFKLFFTYLPTFRELNLPF